MNPCPPPVPVRRVTAGETHSIRLRVLRPGFPPESAVFDGDTDPGSLHFGAFLADQLVGVASLFEVPPEGHPGRALQLRGMATLPEVRGKGCGRRILDACLEAANLAGIPLLWCNARESAVGFYSKQGWQVVGERFDIPTVGPHYRMLLRTGRTD